MDPQPDPIDPLASPQVEAMVAAWQRGEQPPAEAFLSESIDDEAALRLIFEEYCLRQESGMAAEPTDFAARFPRLWPELELLLDCQRLMQATPGVVELPEAGDDLAGFRLIHELGRGALGKVFLAEESELADRPVVVKVSPIGRAEHLSLARLQHMSIVPLYSARVIPERSLQVLCMPFLGGASLAKILELIQDREPSRRTGFQLVEALDQVEASLPVKLEARGPFRRHLARSSYPEAIVWVGVCLAEGLRYAHERDFVHMDIKPSNVLIAGDGQPMLLDFHLAREPIAPGDPPPSQLGGTPIYMAPEQSRALAAVAKGRPVPTPVDGRADLFALGAILDEALGGEVPAEGRRLPLHRRNPRVPVGLSDIIARCLEADPASRYPDAKSLAADLRRFLDGLPLQGVANRSVAERWRNWRRRSPHALTRGAILAVAFVVACSAVGLLRAGYLQRIARAETALEEGRALLARREFAEASRSLKRGQAIVEPLPGTDTLRDELAEALAATRRLAKADELHRLAELVRFRYGIDPPPLDEARALIARGEEIWRERDSILKPTEPVALDPVVREDLLDFTLAWVSFRNRLASKTESNDAARKDALRVLDEAASLLGATPAVDRERRAILGVTGSPERSDSLPRTAREYFDLGQSYLRSGETASAAEQFKRGLSLRPQDFWLNFYEGLTAYRLGRFEAAANAFRVAIALAPESAEGYYNRALALGALGRLDEAVGDYTRAIERNPKLGVAVLNRGMLHYQARRCDEAVEDLNRALSLATDRTERAMIRYNLGLVSLAQGNRPAAIAHLDAASALEHQPARSLRDKLKAGAVVKPD